MRVPIPAMALIAFAFGSSFSRGAHAQEYCIACSEPSAVYRCVIGDARLAQGEPLPQLCASTLAKQGRHATCGVRGGTVFDCDGPIRRVAVPPSNSPPVDKALPSPQEARKEEAPPDTAAQVAKRIVRSSGDQVEKTGSAVGNSAKKAWNCFASFFQSC